MSAAENILSNIIAWAQREAPIRALILDGSRAAQTPPDELADFDIKVFGRTHEPYTRVDAWLAQIGEVWVYIPEKYEWRGQVVPTRLVIFKDGVKVDFSFVNAEILTALTGGDEALDAGYTVLLDKDGLTANLPAPTYKRPPRTPPTAAEFRALVHEFWFEAYHVAKYLRREELWLVKFRDWATKELLLRMIEWHAQSNHQWAYDTLYAGRRIKSWADARVWHALSQVFAHFERADSWRGLLATIELFRQLAGETAERLGYDYPEEVDRNLTGYILKLKG